MNKVLEDIISYKKEYIKTITVTGERNRKMHRLEDSIKDGKINIIAEIKASSPSAGFINNIDLNEILPVYMQYSSAISVLTDEKFFGGSFERLKTVADRTSLPVLCKDFIIDKVQIDKAYVCGADMILLITRILDDEKLEELYDYAKSLGLDVLVEIHTIQEVERIKGLQPKITGVNSRDLDTLSISLERAKKILKSIDFNTLKIAESGIKTKEDIAYLKESCSAFLIGETLVKNSNGLKETFLEFLNCCQAEDA